MPTTDNRGSTPGPFITQVTRPRDDGLWEIHQSRRHRKWLPPFLYTKEGVQVPPAVTRSAWLRWWAPHRPAWWISLTFMIGSACFAYGSLCSNWPGILPREMTAGSVTGPVFFIGSLFFTTAAGLQWLEAINGDVADIGDAESHGQRAWRWFAWKPHNAGYCAGLIQFCGTLLFNLNTGDALFGGLDWIGKDLLIWIPNLAGSLCFLAASYLALMEISHGWWSFEPRLVAWWIVIINLLGSVAFQLSASYGFFSSKPDAGWEWTANFWTFAGALCFFFASYLMIPELFDADAGRPDHAARSVTGGSLQP